MPLSAGSKLGPYEILSQIGAGGMGEVYRAKDTRLHRDVAIKVSKTEFSERFEREARAVAALNHPHICQIYDVGPNYLVMELIEGSSLKGPLPVGKAIEYAGQILDALDSAHHKGITHRDLKPANILVTKQGIKLLDFGLAKFGGTLKETDSTVTQALTQEGTIAGTLQYMSPEQLQAGQIDSRSDLFAFGCVLYEMLTGKRAFEGKNTASVIAAILEREPPKLDVVPALDRVVRRSLAKDPDQRFQTARDLKAALNWALEQPPVVGAPAVSRQWAYWTAIAAFAAIAIFFAFFRAGETTAPSPVIRATILPPARTSFSYFTSVSAPPVLSPDGRLLVFGAKPDNGPSQLYVRSLDATTPQPLAGTDNATFPFWSPDSRFIGFAADGKLQKIDIAGGPVVALLNNAGPAFRGGSWTNGGTQDQDGVIIFGAGAVGIRKVGASGGSAVPVTDLKITPGRTAHRWPCFLPDGRHFLYLATTAMGSEGDIRIGSLDPDEGGGTAARVLGKANSQAVYSQGQILFLRDQTLMAQAFDTKHLVATGEAVPVTERIAAMPSPAYAIFTASSGGALAYQMGPGANLNLTWFDRTGKPAGMVGDPANLFRINLSPDGKLLAASATVAGNMDIWIYDLARGLRSRFTFDAAEELEVLWSPDGKTLVFDSNRKGVFDLYRKTLNAAAPEELLYADSINKFPTSWSPDGKYLLYHGTNPGSGSDIFVLPLAPGGKPFPFVKGNFAEGNGTFSPDGHWVAYQSNESGRPEIYVAPFPGAGGKRQVSIAGGSFPRWQADGRELFYITSDQKLMAAEMSLKADSVEVGAVRALFRGLSTENGYQYGVSADGQRFLAILPPLQSGPPEPLTLVLNWIAGLKK